MRPQLQPALRCDALSKNLRPWEIRINRHLQRPVQCEAKRGKKRQAVVVQQPHANTSWLLHPAPDAVAAVLIRRMTMFEMHPRLIAHFKTLAGKLRLKLLLQLRFARGAQICRVKKYQINTKINGIKL